MYNVEVSNTPLMNDDFPRPRRTPDAPPSVPPDPERTARLDGSNPAISKEQEREDVPRERPQDRPRDFQPTVPVEDSPHTSMKGFR